MSFTFKLKSLEFHDFHLVESSFYPFFISSNLFFFFSSVVFYLHSKISFLFVFVWLLIFLSTLFNWLYLVYFESIKGHHTVLVQKGLCLGFYLFLVSEVMFFFTIFWALFSCSLGSTLQLGYNWPSYNIIYLMGSMHSIPLLNTLILICSSFWFTIALRCLSNGFFNLCKFSLYITGCLGALFTCIQIYEYSVSLISISDSTYGSIFYFGTGFHGFHVTIGVFSIGYFCTLTEYSWINWAKNHKKLLKFSLLYWHFVDIIWIILYLSFYWVLF